MNLSKANKYTEILIALGFVFVFLLSIIECSKGDVSGPQVQGGVALLMVATFIAGTAIYGFSFIHRVSERLPVSTLLGFWVVLTIGVLISVGVITVILGAIGFGFEFATVVRVYIMNLVIFSFGIIPLATFWWLVAWKT